jgi:hypothetical protein
MLFVVLWIFFFLFLFEWVYLFQFICWFCFNWVFFVLNIIFLLILDNFVSDYDIVLKYDLIRCHNEDLCQWKYINHYCDGYQLNVEEIVSFYSFLFRIFNQMMNDFSFYFHLILFVLLFLGFINCIFILVN